MLFAPAADLLASTDDVAEVEDLLQASQYDAEKKSELLRQGLERTKQGLKETKSDSLKQAQWLYNLWFYHFLNEDYGESIQALERALVHLSHTNNGVEQQLKTLTELSYSLILIGRIAESKNHLRRALVLAIESNDDDALSEIYYGLGDAYRKTGDMSVAQRYFEAALALEKAANKLDHSNATTLKLGSLARYKENYAEAIDKHSSARQYFSGKNPYRKIVAEIELAKDYLGIGDIEKSKYYARAAAKNPIALTEQRLDAEIQLLKAINVQQSNNALSDAQLSEASQLIKGIESTLKQSIDSHVTDLSRPVQQIQFAEVSMRHHSLNDNQAEVFRIGDSVIELITKIAAELKHNQEDYLAWMASVQPILNEYVSNLYRHDRDKIFALLEEFYNNDFSSTKINKTDFLSQSIEAQEIKLLDTYLQTESALVDAATDRDRQQQLGGKAIITVTLDSLERQRDLAREAYLHIKDLKLDQRPAQLEDVGNVDAAPPQVPEGELYLRYFVQEAVSFVVVSGQGVPEYHALPPRSVVQKMIDEAHTDLASQNGGYSHSLAVLTTLLPLDLIKENNKIKKLVIVPDDVVYSAPFSAINLADDSGEYLPLIDRYQIVRTNSMNGYYSDRTTSSTDTESKTPDIIIFSDPVFNPKRLASDQNRSTAVSHWAQGLERLPYTASEAREIQQIFPKHSVTAYQGAQATAAVLMSNEARSAKILHIATHGYFNVATPEIVGIATSPYENAEGNHNGFLSLSKFLNRPFSGNLVIISGCETMRGKHYNGQGVKSMSKGFLEQGAGSVIGSLWEVSDRATAKLMAGFYRDLKTNGGNSASALQSAKLALAKSSRYSAPKYWAGFVLHSSNHHFDQKVFDS